MRSAANIRVDTRGGQVMRVLPRLNDDVNEEWISDKTRHAIDGLRYQRLDRPYVRKGGKLVEATWDEAFEAIDAKLKGLDGSKIAAIVGDQCDAEAMVALKDLMAALGSPNIDCRQDGAKLEAGVRGSYIFNAGRTRHRPGRRDPADRHQSALGIAGAECPHPQALPPWPLRHRQHRSGGRSHLSGRAAGRGARDPA